MRAVYFEKHGGLDVFKSGQLPDPKINSSQDVLIQIHACALNHLDIWARIGLPGITLPMPHILGADISGVVLEAGSDVKNLKKGDRVVLSPGQLPDSAVQNFVDRDSYSPDFKILGLQVQGGYAEKIVVSSRYVIKVSDKYSFEEWAALPLAGLTAYHMLVTRAQLKKGEKILIQAGASGIGTFAIQLAKKIGATVYTTVGSENKIAAVKALGADFVIDYKKEDFSESIKKLTNGQGVDVVFEHIGPDTWQKSLLCLSRGGRLVTCGATSGGSVQMDLRPFFSKQLSILGSYMGSLNELHKVIALAEEGALRSVIDKIFPLEEAAKAHDRMESRQNIGKIVLKV